MTDTIAQNPSISSLYRSPAIVAAGVAAFALGIVALSLPALFGPYGPLVLVLLGLPFGAVGLVGAAAALGLWRGTTWGRRLAVIWGALISVAAALGLIGSWVPVISALGDPNTWYNVARPELYFPIPLLAGGGYVTLAVLRVPRSVGFVAASLFGALLLVIVIAAVASLADPGLQPAPIGPAPTAP